MKTVKEVMREVITPTLLPGTFVWYMTNEHIVKAVIIGFEVHSRVPARTLVDKHRFNSHGDTDDISQMFYVKYALVSNRADEPTVTNKEAHLLHLSEEAIHQYLADHVQGYME